MRIVFRQPAFAKPTARRAPTPQGLRRGGGLGLLHVGRQSFAEGPIFPLVRREVYLHVLRPQTGISREQFRYPLIEPLLGGGVPPVTG